jgi:hypothetical protein
MYSVMRNVSQRVEGSYVHCNMQQYWDSGEFLCTLKCAIEQKRWRVLMHILMYKIHTQYSIPMYIAMYKITHTVECSHIKYNVQLYTYIIGF